MTPTPPAMPLLGHVGHREILASITDGIIVADGTGKMQFFNAAAERLLGVACSDQPPDEWSKEYGVFLADGVTSCPTDQLPLVRALQGEFVPPTDLVISNSTFSEKKRISARAGPIRDQSGDLAGGVVVFHDITDERKTEQRLQEHAARLEELNLALEQLSQTDELTGLPSRRSFDSAVSCSMDQNKESGTALSLLIVDVDHFKHVNDLYGHLAGDEVLRQLASLIQESLTEDDFAARFGGEEFALLLRPTSLDAAAERAEELRRLVEAASFNYQTEKLHITASIGVSQATDSDDADSLFHRADVALYVAKDCGRNCVSISECCGATRPVIREGEIVRTPTGLPSRRAWTRQRVSSDRSDAVLSNPQLSVLARVVDKSPGGMGLLVPESRAFELGQEVELAWERTSRVAVIRNMGIAEEGVWRIGIAWPADPSGN